VGEGEGLVSLTAVAVAVLCCVSPALAEEPNGDLGYTLLIPPDWERTPDEVVEGLTLQIVAPSSPDRPFYDAAFQKGGSERWFACRYVLLRRIEIERQPTIAEMLGFVAETSGLSASDVEDVFRSDIRELVSDVEIGGAVLDAERGVAVFTGEGTAEAGEAIRMRSVAYFGQRYIVLIHSYHFAARFEEAADAFDEIAASFAFDEGLGFRSVSAAVPSASGVDPSPAPVSSRSYWRTVFTGFLICVVLTTAIRAITRLRPRRRTRDGGEE